MKVECNWKEKLSFTATAGSHLIAMDTTPPLGTDSGPTPKQLILMAVCGCSAMDVIALLKKHKQSVLSFTVDAEASVVNSQPAVFEEINLRYVLTGNIEPALAVESVTLSQTKYCSVSAMLSKAVAINYIVELNGLEVGRGGAAFPS
jgi:putative redox protein